MAAKKETTEEAPEALGKVQYRVTASYDTLQAGDLLTVDLDNCDPVDAAAIKSGILRPFDGSN